MCSDRAPGTNEFVVKKIETPSGAFTAVMTPLGLSWMGFPSEPPSSREAWLARWMPGARRTEPAELVSAALSRLAEELNGYFEGRRRQFTVPLDLRGTEFQLRVWESLRRIPFGQVCTYAQVAADIGQPKAVRAVGGANHVNPVPIIVPCHRVIGSDGRLVGYAEGLDLKRELLRIEGFGACLSV